MKFLLSLILVTGCAASQQQKHFEAEQAEVIAFRDSMAAEFSAFFNANYYRTSASAQHRIGLRKALLRFNILLDELNSCIKGAKQVADSKGNGVGLYCAQAVTAQLLNFLDMFGIEPVELPTFIRIIDGAKKASETIEAGTSGNSGRTVSTSK